MTDRTTTNEVPGQGMTQPVVNAEGLRLSFGPTRALSGVDLTVARGEAVAVTGPSGSGKSTLLLALAGVLTPDSGRVTIAGVALAGLSDDARTRFRRDTIGLVLQFGQLVPELTALENVSLPLRFAGVTGDVAADRARAWLARVGAGELGAAYPSRLSGGQQQRVALARALVIEPAVLLADEPTGALDTLGTEELVGVMLEVVRDSGTSLVVATHDNRVAAAMDREVVLVDGLVARPAVSEANR